MMAGDRVGYSQAWLQSTGMYTGSIPHARGTVTLVEYQFGSTGLATVDWDSAGPPEKVLVGNLAKIGSAAWGGN
jgi:hypothetical protein